MHKKSKDAILDSLVSMGLQSYKSQQCGTFLQSCAEVDVFICTLERNSLEIIRK